MKTSLTLARMTARVPAASPADRRARVDRRLLPLWRARVFVILSGAGASVLLLELMGQLVAGGFPWWLYFVSLGSSVAVVQLLAVLFWRAPDGPVVGFAEGEDRIGRYSRGDLARMLSEVGARSLRGFRPLRLFIDDTAQPQAATVVTDLSFWPRWRRVEVTRGALGYLEPDELRAVLFHEAGHHHWRTRIIPPRIGWLFDLILHAALVLWVASVSFSFVEGPLAVLCGFLSGRTLIRVYAWELEHAVYSHETEIACDRFAAERSGALPLANALLKLSEDDELHEQIATRVAHTLRREFSIEIEEIYAAIHNCRPAGRMFHANLFRHAAETIRVLRDAGCIGDEIPTTGPLNGDLVDFVRMRRQYRGRRVRWREFDTTGRGRLNADEIHKLCRALRADPEADVVAGPAAWDTESHPPTRDRILLLEDGGWLARAAE